MKRKLILMAIIAFSGFSIEANAAVNDEALSNVQNKMIEYINNYSLLIMPMKVQQKVQLIIQLILIGAIM